MSNLFETLYKIDVKQHIEKKGQFSYLSWPYAVAELRKSAPDATWETIKFDGKPYCETKAGCFVEVAVTVNGITLSQVHPVLDMRNKTILAPDAFQINTSIQRCLVKAIALHGLGLYIYAGEDLPENEPKTEPKIEPKHVLDVPAYDKPTPERIEVLKEKAAEIVDFHSKGMFEDAFVIYDNISDNAERNELWFILKPNSAVRTKITEINNAKKVGKQ
jgi:Protein of unknown function (DUF1071)